MAKAPFKEKPAEIHAKNIVTLKERIKSKDICGLYIFYGDEEYTKNHYCTRLSAATGESLNVTSIYGSEFELTAFISACETSAIESFDMFSVSDESDGGDGNDEGIRVIKLINPDFSSMDKKDTQQFLDFISTPHENTVIIIWLYSGSEDILSKDIYKEIAKSALVVNFKKEAVGSSVLITWILRHFAKEKLNCDRYVAVHLCQTVGNSMTDLKNEIDKLIDYVRFENRDTITLDDVNFICIKCMEAQVFDISQGALNGNFLKAATALEVLRDKKEAPVMIMGTISKAVRDMCVTDICIKSGISIPAIASSTGIPEFVVKRSAEALNNRKHDFHGNNSFPASAAALVKEYDKKLKSSRTDGFELLLELIFKLSYCGKISAC